MKIALTFDIERDLPTTLDTYSGLKIGLLKILRLLENYNLNATFFCTGNVAQRYPAYLKLIEGNGHEIACHSLNHERLTLLSFEECHDVVLKSKQILERICQESEIIGFRAPYLKAPKFLFEILHDLGFKYDSSFSSKTPEKRNKPSEIEEFAPSTISGYFRFPLTSSFISRVITKSELIVLYFHPWEFVNMKNIITRNLDIFVSFKNILFRPDRWWNTGKSFKRILSNYLDHLISNQCEFITLRQLCGY
jgi:peptidoglycan/xylan/chitin deacetylase (PgdA/CDA1 family)